MEPIVTPSLIPMTILTTMAVISPIYGTSTVTFDNDTQAYTIVNID